MCKEEYRDWYHLTADITLNKPLQYKDCYDVGQEAWDYKEKQLQEMIEDIEQIPTSMSCYVSLEERQAAVRMKESILKILKG
jgi:hypothetical protein